MRSKVFFSLVAATAIAIFVPTNANAEGSVYYNFGQRFGQVDSIQEFKNICNSIPNPLGKFKSEVAYSQPANNTANCSIKLGGLLRSANVNISIGIYDKYKLMSFAMSGGGIDNVSSSDCNDFFLKFKVALKSVLDKYPNVIFQVKETDNEVIISANGFGELGRASYSYAKNICTLNTKGAR